MKKKELNVLIESIKKIMEDINVPINVGDTVLGGKFKNKKIKVKDIDKNEKGDITINDKPLLRVRTLKNEDYRPSKNFYKATIKVSDLYVESDNMMDAYYKSKNVKGPSSRSGDKPLTIAKLLDGTLLLLDGHHRIVDNIKSLERPNIKNILNLKFEAIIHKENFESIESIEQADSDFQYWIHFIDWVYTTFQKQLSESNENKFKNVDVVFNEFKNSNFNTLKEFTLNDIVNKWKEVENIKNDNIDTIKYFLNKIKSNEKIDCLIFNKEGLSDGFHRLIAMKISNIKQACFIQDDNFLG